MFTYPTTFLGHATGSGGGGSDPTVFGSRDDYVVFDGTNDQVLLDSIDFSTGGSISLWFYSEASHAGIILVSRHTSTNRVSIDVSSSTVRASYYTGSYFSESETYTVGQWNHLVFTHDGSNNVTGYLNGTAMTGSSNAQVSSVTNGKMSFSGRNHSPTTDPFNGRLRDIRYYDDVLTSDEATYLYTEGSSGTDPTNDNLQGHWKIDEAGGVTITDSAGSNNGSLKNVTEPAFWDKYAVFDQSDDFVTVPYDASFKPTGDFSIAGWIRPSDVTGGTHRVIEYGNANWGSDGFLVNQYQDDIFWYFNSGGPVSTATAVLTVDTWHHIAVTRSGDEFKLYVDGTLEDTDTKVASITGNREIRMGSNAGSQQFGGGMYGMRFYDDTLTADEVTYLHTAGESGTDPGTTNLVSLWSYTDVSGSTVADGQGSNDGTATNIIEPDFWRTTHVQFDGTNDYIELPGTIDLTSGGSIAFWLKMDVAAATNEGVFEFDSSAGNEIYAFLDSTEKIRLQWFNSSASKRRIIGNTVISQDEWNHVVITQTNSGDDVVLYLNGSDDSGTESAGAGSDPTSGENHLGKVLGTLEGDISMSDFRIYSDVLTANEITYLATAGESGTDPGTANLTGHWKLNDRYGTNVNDLGSGDNDGTATNITEADFWIQ
jgi:hypothetical protein